MTYFKVTYRNKHFLTHTDYIKANSFFAAKDYADNTARFFEAPHDGVSECGLSEIRNGNGNSIVDITDREPEE